MLSMKKKRDHKKSDAKLDGKIRQFYRLLMSYQDFQQAFGISSYIIDNKLLKKRIKFKQYEDKLLLEALTCAMIMAYCRPFSANEKKTELKIPNLPTGILKVLNVKEKEVHNVVMANRNTLLAHSDSSAWNLRPYVFETKSGRKTLVPLSYNTKAPLTDEATVIFKNMSEKLMEKVFEKRMEFERELKEHLPVVKEDDE